MRNFDVQSAIQATVTRKSLLRNARSITDALSMFALRSKRRIAERSTTVISRSILKSLHKSPPKSLTAGVVARIGFASLICVLGACEQLPADETEAKVAENQPAEVAAADVIKTVWRGKAGTLDVFDNSPTLSNVMAVNSQGHVLGMHEQVDSKIAVLNQQFFFADSKVVRTIPKLKGFTNLYCEALSDNGRVVGYASRAPGNPDGTLTGFVWDSSTDKIVRLPPLPSDLVCHATDISASGQRIAGYSTGSEPPRIRPCVWDWDVKLKKWSVMPLPVLHDHNPYVVTGSISISPDGNYVAACCTERLLPNNLFDNALFRWKIDGAVAKRTRVSDLAARVDAVNNKGQIAGAITDATGRFAYVTSQGDELIRIDLLDGDIQGQAHAVDSNGRVYGMSDDPAGPTGGPEAFIFADGKVAQLPFFAGRGVYSVANDVNEKGQIVGFVDVLVQGVSLSLPENPEQLEKLEESEENYVKTLGFRWTPRVQPR